MRTVFVRWVAVALFWVLAAVLVGNSRPAWAGSEDVPVLFFSTPPQRAAAAFSPPPPYFGDNLSSSAIKSKLIAAGQKYRIPPHVLFGIAYQESLWKQFRNDRRTTYHLEPDGRVGVGMMQMTVDPSDPTYERLCTDVDYNIDRAAALLDGKWRATPIIGDNARDKIENWYFAIWAYNGFICPNPNDYAPKVLIHIGHGRTLWTPVTITAPNVNNSNCSLSRIAITPSPIHIDSNFDGIIDAVISQPPSGTSLFADNFDSRTSAAGWQVNTSIPNTTESEVDFAYDYSQLGIPSPLSSGGTTIGARFLSNKGTDSTTNAGNLQGISASPIGQSFSGNFKIRFDLWINYVGSLGTGGTSTPPGSGSTQMASAGWGTSGNGAQWGGSNHSVVFSADGDGGTTADYRAYRASTTALTPSSGAYAAGTGSDANNSSNTYYNSFGEQTAPAQAALFPSQTGTTPSGALGFAWRDVLIEKSDNTLTWTIDGKRIATVDVSGVVLGGSNLFLGMFDINATSSVANDQLNAAIFDNLRVSSASATQGAILSEFRFRGPGGSADEYVEIYNTLKTPLDISGWSLQINAGTAAVPNIKTTVVPQNTKIPAQGHFLFAGSAYSLGGYGVRDALLTGDAAFDSGAVLFNELGAVQDAVGFASSLSTFRQGAGLPSAPGLDLQHAWMRDFSSALPKDSGNSSADFVLLTPNGAPVASASGNIPAQLGAPNPEGLASPVNINPQIGVSLLYPTAGPNAAPNRERIGSGNEGSLLLRRTIRNLGTQPLSKLRLFVTRITSQGSPAGIVPNNQADVRLIASGNETVTFPSRDAGGNIIKDGAGNPVNASATVFGTLLEAPSIAVATTGASPNIATNNGGGLGSGLSFDLVLPTPLQAGQEANYAFNLQIAKGGTYLVAFNILAKP